MPEGEGLNSQTTQSPGLGRASSSPIDADVNLSLLHPSHTSASEYLDILDSASSTPSDDVTPCIRSALSALATKTDHCAPREIPAYPPLCAPSLKADQALATIYVDWASESLRKNRDPRQESFRIHSTLSDEVFRDFSLLLALDANYLANASTPSTQSTPTLLPQMVYATLTVQDSGSDLAKTQKQPLMSTSVECLVRKLRENAIRPSSTDADDSPSSDPFSNLFEYP